MLQKAQITGKKILTYDVFELELKSKIDFEFSAGQFITIKIDDKGKVPCFRAYSIASAPRKDEIFELCIKIIKEGRGSNWLNQLKIGDEIKFMGPNGELKFKKDTEKKALFIATGTGIAPLKSIIDEELKNGNKQQFELIFGLRYEKDIIYKEFFEKLAKKHKNFKFKLTLSRPDSATWKGSTGRVTNLLEHLKIDTKTDVYICGLKDMIESIEVILKEKGVPREAMHTEKYD